MKLSLLPLIALVLLTGCGTFRGIPSHGGGKRFDEEQRIVAGAIRQTISEMNLQELRGRRVRVVLESIAHDGSGNVNWSGLTSMNLNSSVNWNENNYVLNAQGLRVSDSESSGVSGGVGYRALPEYYSSSAGTSADLSYLQAVLEMKARHDGLLLEGQADSVLYVLVDVLGTNRSRRTYMLKGTDDYHASCEITYYSQDLASGQLLFRERQTGAVASYVEEHTTSSPWVTVQYPPPVTICPQVPLLDEADRPVISEPLISATQPQAADPTASDVPQPSLLAMTEPATQPSQQPPLVTPPPAPVSPAEPAAVVAEPSVPTPATASPQSQPAASAPVVEPATQPSSEPEIPSIPQTQPALPETVVAVPPTAAAEPLPTPAADQGPGSSEVPPTPAATTQAAAQ